MSIDENWDQSGLVGKLAAGRYMIVKDLGTDSRRTLYEAEDAQRGERVMLAVIRSPATTDKLRIADKLRSLEHPALARVLDAGKLESGELYVATERAVGAPLRTLVGDVDQKRALAITRQVLDALAVAHAAGAVHGDIKPENINITSDGRTDQLKLLDLGVATLSRAAGDARYSAPESAGLATDARADIYSVGALLFELLTGHPPFFADDANALRRLHAYAPVQTLRQRAPDVTFSDALEAMVAKALAKKTSARYQRAQEMIEALDQAASTIQEPTPEPVLDAAGEPHDDSLLLLAKDLMPAAKKAHAESLIVPVNVERRVPELPWQTRAQSKVRRVLEPVRARLRGWLEPVRARIPRLLEPVRRLFAKLTRRQKLILAAVPVLVLVIVLAWPGDEPPQVSPDDIATRSAALIEQGKHGEATELIRREITTRPSLATTPEVIGTLSRIANTGDPAAAMSALELIAARSGKRGNDTIVSHASTNQRAQVRHRATELAERAGIAAKIDRVESWSLDLDQATTCAERLAAINKLATATDARALPALERAKAHKCVQREATAAIEKLKATPVP